MRASLVIMTVQLHRGHGRGHEQGSECAERRDCTSQRSCHVKGTMDRPAMSRTRDYAYVVCAEGHSRETMLSS